MIAVRGGGGGSGNTQFVLFVKILSLVNKSVPQHNKFLFLSKSYMYTIFKSQTILEVL